MKNCGKWKLGGPDTSPPLLTAHAHIYTVGAQLGCKLVKTVDTVGLILLAITFENSGRSCTGRKSVVSHHKSVGVVHKSITMVVPWSGVLRLEFHADIHTCTTDMRALPPSHVGHKSLS